MNNTSHFYNQFSLSIINDSTTSSIISVSQRTELHIKQISENTIMKLSKNTYIWVSEIRLSIHHILSDVLSIMKCKQLLIFISSTYSLFIEMVTRQLSLSIMNHCTTMSITSLSQSAEFEIAFTGKDDIQDFLKNYICIFCVR